mgnify:CR=1 FL=1
MSGGEVDLPSGMRRFNELDLGRPFLIRFIGAVGGVSFVVALFSWFLNSATDNVVLAILPVVAWAVLVWRLYGTSSMLHVPLAVNMNHPFMSEEDPIGVAVVMVRLSDGHWIDLGEGRVRLAYDELMGGSTLVRDNEDYTLIGHFSSHPISHRGLKKQIAILNQALALRDVMNGEEDTFEEAREREGMDTGLLERSWLEEQESIEIEPDGLMNKLRGE